jgi:hypothetical protein
MTTGCGHARSVRLPGPDDLKAELDRGVADR